MPEAHLLHILPAFTTGGAQMRIAQIVNHFGARFTHTVLSLSDDFSAAQWIAPDIDVAYRQHRNSGSSLHMIREITGVIKGIEPHLVLTYNWGSMDGVTAALLAGAAPVIHSEDGFGDDEAVRQKLRRVWYRRVVLRGVYAAVAPSQNLARVMREIWKLPDGRVRYIPNGVDVSRFSPGFSGMERREIVIGTVSQLRREKRQRMLIEACAAAAPRYNVRLVFVGDGPERSGLEQHARKLNFADKLTFFGHISCPEECYRSFDVFALSSSTEQMPISVLEGMASGLPVLSTDVGDIKNMVTEANQPFVVAPSGYQNALERLLSSKDLRRQLGAENRTRCIEYYSLHRMLRTYEALYDGALAQRGRLALKRAS